MRGWGPSVLAAAALAAWPAHAAHLPQAVLDMLAAAADDPAALTAVARAAKTANPGAEAEVDVQVAALTRRVAAERKARVADLGPLQGWRGKAEVGGSISTGNDDSEGGSLALTLEREAVRWDQDLSLSLDFKREDGETTKDRDFGAYALRWNLNRRLYAVGVLWGERDRFAGYNYRFSESVGLGYRVIARPDMRLRLEAGPAFRQSEYLVTGRARTAAARAAGYFTWKISPRLEVSQSAVTYLEQKNSTVLANTALTTGLLAGFSVRASYELRHEVDPPEGRENTDTTTRLTLVYSF